MMWRVSLLLLLALAWAEDDWPRLVVGAVVGAALAVLLF